MLTVALGVAVVLVLTVAVVLGIKAWQGKQAEDARDQAAAAGRKAAETALSYDYRDLDKSFAAARATMTPEFAGKFDETAKVAGELATKTKATVKADVREVGVRDGDADRVTLIIFVNQTTTSTITQGKPRVDLNRTRFTMVRKGDQWLVQEIAGL
jgi:Mce-associated membrane protein